MAVLGCLYRHGELTVGELAAHERVQPPSMTRTVNCLEEGGVRRPPAARHRRPPGRGRPVRPGPRDACSPTGPAATPGWPSGCGADRRRARRAPQGRPHPRTNSPRRTDPPPLEPHVPLPRQPQLPPLRRRRRRVERRHLDAAGRPGLAGAAAHRLQRRRVGITTGLQFLPFLLLSPFAGLVADRFPKRRLLQLTNLGMAVPALVLGLLAVTGTAEIWHVYVLALRARRRRRLRRPGPAVVRLRDRRPGRPDQRGRPQLRRLQRRPHRRPGASPAC